MHLILASTSKTRQALLRTVGVPFESQPARVDEDSVRLSLESEGAHPRDIADTLAELKAQRIANKQADVSTLVLGGDQVLDIKGKVFSKPESKDDAASQLAELSGKTHHLLSAAVLYEGTKPIWRHVGVARMTMHLLSSDDIDSYLDKAWPDVEGSVGAYHAEGYGARLFSRIDGDWFSVLGLPLLEFCSFLRLRGWLDP